MPRGFRADAKAMSACVAVVCGSGLAVGLWHGDPTPVRVIFLVFPILTTTGLAGIALWRRVEQNWGGK